MLLFVLAIIVLAWCPHDAGILITGETCTTLLGSTVATIVLTSRSRGSLAKVATLA